MPLGAGEGSECGAYLEWCTSHVGELAFHLLSLYPYLWQHSPAHSLGFLVGHESRATGGLGRWVKWTMGVWGRVPGSKP